MHYIRAHSNEWKRKEEQNLAAIREHLCNERGGHVKSPYAPYCERCGAAIKAEG